MTSRRKRNLSDAKIQHILTTIPLWWIRRGIFWKNECLDDHVVLNLTAPFLGKGRNITCDNFFTSTNLAKLLSSKKTSIVGTVNRIGSEIPKVIKTKKQFLYSSTFSKSDNIQMEERSYPSQLNIIMGLNLASMTSIKWLGFILLWHHAEDGLFKSSTTSSACQL